MISILLCLLGMAAPFVPARREAAMPVALARSAEPRFDGARDTAAAGAIRGTVVDAATRQPLPGVTVRIRELGRRELSHADGTFHFDGVAAGSYTLLAERIGYAPAEAAVRVRDGEAVEAALALSPSALRVAGVVATGTGRERGRDEAYAPTRVLDGAELRRRLGATVAATLAGEPGVAQRYNGPGASQPVIRGLGGDRVLVLEDGQRTGDIAGSAADHGVMVEPLTAERVEVVRGPAGLLYGSNALGGVVNVIRDEVPRSLPDRPGGSVSVQGESASRGLAAGGAVLGALGGFALRGEASVRSAGDTRTPLGDLPSTGMEGYSLGGGISRVGASGFAGIAVRDHDLRYGVPGTFRGARIPGAHEGGVEIDVHRTAVRGQAALLTGVGPFRALEADVNAVRFRQHELDREGGGEPFVATSFEQRLATASLLARHGVGARGGEGGFRHEGAVGLWALGKDLDVGGLSTGSASARQLSLAGFAYEEVGWGRWALEAGARYDFTRVVPDETRRIDGVETEARTFGALSGSAAAVARLGGGWSAGVRGTRSFRSPSVEELYSRGPHLASYSYEIGNPRLGAETGWGGDLFVRVGRGRLDGELTVYRNAIDNFIHHAATGALDPRFGRYPVYQARGEDAVFTGAEAAFQWSPLRAWAVEAAGSVVRAERRAGGALPAIPPARASFHVRRDVPRWFAEAGAEAVARQNRVGEFETPTAGYLLLNAGAGLRMDARGRLHTLTLQADNLTDRVWRDHLSRIKEVAPQPGLNLRLLYRVDF